jgi:hypothetical protein
VPTRGTMMQAGPAADPGGTLDRPLVLPAHGFSLTSTVCICRRSALCARLLLRSACAAGE